MQKPCAKGFCYAKPQLFTQTGKAKSLAPLATQQLRVVNQDTRELAIPIAYRLHLALKTSQILLQKLQTRVHSELLSFRFYQTALFTRGQAMLGYIKSAV